MNLAELVQSRRDGRSYGKLSEDGGGTPKAARWSQLGTEGGMGTNALDPPTVEGVSRALYTTRRLVWLAIGETLGLDVWEDTDDLWASLPISLLQRLKPRHWDVLTPVIRIMAEDAGREDEIGALRARAAELEARLAELEPKRPRRRPARE